MTMPRGLHRPAAGLAALLALGTLTPLSTAAGADAAGLTEAAPPASASVVALVRSDEPALPRPAPSAAPLDSEQVAQQVRRATDLAGLPALVTAAAARADGAPRVVIKPNIVDLKESGSGVVTDWRVVRGIVLAVIAAAPRAHIAIAEGSGSWVTADRSEVIAAIPGIDVGDGFGLAGYRRLERDPALADVDLSIVDLNFDEAVETPVPVPHCAQPSFFMPRTVREADLLIDAPVLKIIGMVGMTVSMKNFIGIAPGLVYGWSKSQGFLRSGRPGIPHDSGNLDDTIVDLTALSGVDFSVVDGIVGMERARTDDDEGRPVRLNTIVAGADVVAVDATCARLIGLNPDDIEYLTLAEDRGLGTTDAARIRVVGQQVAQVGRRFEKYPADWGHAGANGHYGQGNRRWLLKGPLPRAVDGAVAIDPDAVSPLPEADGWSGQVYFHDNRIDLDRYYGNPTECVAYAYAEFAAAAAQAAELWVGSDEGLRVWLNGELAYEFAGTRRHRLPNERVAVSVRQGRNRCLVEATQTRGRYEFSLKLCEPESDPRYDGNAVTRLVWSLPGPLTATPVVLARTSDEGGGDWFEEQQVDLTRPRRLKLAAFLPAAASGPWLSLDAPLVWGRRMEAEAWLREDGSLQVQTENVARLALRRAGALVEANQLAGMVIDGWAVSGVDLAQGPVAGLQARLSPDGRVSGWAVAGSTPANPLAVIAVAPDSLGRDAQDGNSLDSPLGDWCADAIRWATGADVAFQNAGGIRRSLPAGAVTVQTIFGLNFPDELLAFQVTGRELAQMLEHDLRDGNDRPLQVSGLCYAFAPWRPQGSRLVDTSLDPERLYRVAAEDFLIERGVQFFGRPVEHAGTGVHVVDAQVRYAAHQGTIVAPATGRIRRVEPGP